MASTSSGGRTRVHPVRRLLTGLVGGLLLLVMGLAAALALLLPRVDRWHGEIEQWASAQLGHRVRLEALQGEWVGLSPTLTAAGLVVSAGDGAASAPPLLSAPSLRLAVDPLALVSDRFMIAELAVNAPRVSLKREEDGRIGLAAVPPRSGGAARVQTGALAWLVTRTDVRFEDGELEWHDARLPGGRAVLSRIRARLTHADSKHHRLSAGVSGLDAPGSRMGLAAEIRGELLDPSAWEGRVALTSPGLDLGSLVLLPSGGRRLAGQAQGRLEMNLERDLLARAHGTVLLRDLELPGVGDIPPLRLAEVGGGFRWSRHEGGWSLDMQGLTLRAGRQPWRVGALALARRDDLLTLAAKRIQLADVVAQLPWLEVSAPWTERLRGMRPLGAAADVEVRWRDSVFEAFQARLQDVGVRSDGSSPGLAGLDGLVTLRRGGGTLALDAAEAKVALPRLFRSPLVFDNAVGRLDWERSDEGWALRAREVVLRAGALRAEAAGEVSVPAAGGSPHLRLEAEFAGGDAAQAPAFYPAGVMSPNLVEWLDRAIVGGTVTEGRLVLDGRAADFPFDEAPGTFEVDALIEDGTLDYVPGWPQLEAADVRVIVQGPRMRLVATRGEVGGMTIAAGEAGFATLKTSAPTLELQGVLQGPAERGVEFLRDGPLFKDSPLLPTDLSAQGAGTLHLDVALPLRRLAETRVRGSFEFDGNTVMLPQSIVLSELRGALDFTNRDVNGRGLRGRLLGGDVQFDVSATAKEQPALLVITGSGRAEPAELTPFLGRIVAPRLVGAVPWNAQMLLRGRTRRLDIESTLAGVEIDLPEPVGKPAGETDALIARIEFGVDRPIEVSFDVGARVNGRLELIPAAERASIGAGAITIGAPPAALSNEPGVSVGIHAPFVDLDRWWEVVRGNGDDAEHEPVDVRRLRVEAPSARYLGRPWRNLSVAAALDADGVWQARVAGDGVAGDVEVHLPAEPASDALGDGLVVARFERLYLERLAEAREETTDPRTLPRLEIVCDDFHYGEMQLGRLELSAEPGVRGMRFLAINLTRPEMTVQAQGTWDFLESGHRTALSAEAQSSDLGRTLTGLGYAGYVEDGAGSANGYFVWGGGPGGFEFSKLNGNYQLTATEGRFVKVSPGGGGRLLGLLNIEALARRVSLDFSDVFEQGFAFDRLDGVGIITRGDLISDGFVIVGPAALIEAKGRVGLPQEDYDLELMIAPGVASNISLGLFAALANPAAGAAVFLAQKLFQKRLSKAIYRKYLVTGSWEDPILEPVSPEPSGIPSQRDTIDER